MSKQRVIVEAVLAGKSQREVARLYGISQPRVSQLVAAWRSGGWSALEPRSTRPRTNPNATAPAVVERILALRQELLDYGTDAGPHSIAGILDDEMDSPPSVTTIWRILTRAGAITPEPRKRPKRSWIRFQADLPNECWQSDFTHWPLGEGTDAEILLWVDDHSRFLISATAHTPVTGHIVLNAFRAACDLHGTPQSTLTDNGFVFTTRFRGGANSFEIELLNRGVAQKNGSPNHPQTQGKVERLNSTLKKWLRTRPPARTITELQAQLDEFVDFYNYRRKHRSLNRRTPATIYSDRAKATPEHNRSGHFRIRDDTVHATGSVTLRRGGRMHHIKLGMHLGGTPVRMLIHDLHVTVIDRDTGEILRELVIDPDKDSQPRGLKPGPRPGHRKGGMPKGYKFKK
ncbi:MAG: IS481 family transposase [Candidatus Nanopelagicales bacterium]